MTGWCKSCGSKIGPRTPLALTLMGLSGWPAWLDGFCLNCLYEISGKVNCDEGEQIGEPHVNEYLAEQIEVLARRFVEGRMLVRCEVLSGGHFIGDPDDLQCSRFAAVESNGRKVCGPHARQIARGKLTAFTNAGMRVPRPHVIWARCADDLITEAARQAGAYGGLTP